MKFHFRKELPSLVALVLPFIYLAWIWNDLPETVPTHWNTQGEIDSYSSKSSLWLLPLLSPVLPYIMLFLAPYLDTKKKLDPNSSKHSSLTFIITALTSALTLFILYWTKNQDLNSRFLFGLIGILIAVLGNFFPTLKPNYFIGIRTPWTLDNPANWRKTHRFASKIWMVGGITLIFLGLGGNESHYHYPILLLTGIITLVPVLYSFIHRNDQNPITQ